MQRNLPASSPNGMEPQPFFEQLQQEMERLFDRFRGYPAVAGQGQSQLFARGLSPAIDVAETDDAVEITADVPGVSTDDLEVTLSGDVLVIKGEKSDEQSQEDKNYHMHERSYGSFSRHIPLGFTPAEGAIEGKFADGVLRVSVVKPAEAKAVNRKIKIKTN